VRRCDGRLPHTSSLKRDCRRASARFRTVNARVSSAGPRLPRRPWHPRDPGTAPPTPLTPAPRRQHR
jgi:hypothetical protein